MYLIVTRNGSTRRLAIPADVARNGTAEAYAATVPADVWSAAEEVGAHWPYAAPVDVPPVAPDVAPLDEPAASLPDED